MTDLFQQTPMLRIGIIGVGWAGTRQARAMRELGRKVTLACLVDSDANFLQTKAQELVVAKTYTHIDEVLADPDVDAVSICLPHALHCETAIAAAEAGKHVLCEKPLAMTVDEATRMIAAADAAGVKLYVAENAVYAPMARFLRDMIQSGRYIGEVVWASVTAGFRADHYGYPGRRAWLSTPELGGTGTWMLHGVHTMAQMRYILGEVETVYMREHRAPSFTRTDVEGTMSGLLTMERGFSVAVAQTCEVKMKEGLGGYVIYGTRGSLRADDSECLVYSDEANQEPLRLSYPPAGLSEYAMEVEAFADYVAGVSEGPTTARSERRSLAIIQAGYESAQTGQPVHLRTRFPEL